MAEQKPWYVQAHYNWEATKEGQVPLVRGGIYCVTQELDHGWSLGIDAQNNQGFFPTAYTRRLTAEQEQRLLQRQAQARQQPQPAQGAEQKASEDSAQAQQAQAQAQPQAQPQAQAQQQQQQPAQAQEAQAQAQEAQAQAQAQAQQAQEVRQEASQQASSTDQAGEGERQIGGGAAAAAASSEGGEEAGGVSVSEADGEEKKKKSKKKHKKKSSKSKVAEGESEGKKEKKDKKVKKKASSRSRNKIMSINSSVALFKQEQLNDTNERRWSVQRLGAKEVGDALQQQQLQQQFQKIIEQEYNWQQTLGTVHRDLEAAVNTGDAPTMQRSLQAFGQAQANQVKWIGDLCKNLSARYEKQATTIAEQKAGIDQHLRKLVALQQARCFSPDPAAFGESKAEEIGQVLKDADASVSSKEDVLDSGVSALREKAAGVQRQQSEASKRSQFFQEVDTKGPLASFYAAFSRGFTNVLVGAFSLGDGAATQVSGAGVAAEVQAALRTNVDVGGTSVPVATIARKAVHAWAATSAHDGLVGSLSEEFSHAVAFALLEVYSGIVSKLSLSGAVALAEAAIARMLFLLGQGLVDVTRDPVQQLSHKLSASVTPEQEQNPRPRNSVRIGATELSIPAVLHTQAQVEAILARCDPSRGAVADGHAWREPSVVARAAWTAGGETFVQQGSSEDFGLRHASPEGLTFVQELGWYRVPARAAAPAAESGGEGLAAEVADLKAQLASRQQEEQQQKQTIAALQQQVAGLPQLQATLQEQSQALAALRAELQQLRQQADAAPRAAPVPAAAAAAAASAPVAAPAPVAVPAPAQAARAAPIPLQTTPVAPAQVDAPAPAATAPAQAAVDDLEMFSGDEFDDSLLADAPAEPTPVEKPRAAPLRGSRPTAAAAFAAAPKPTPAPAPAPVPTPAPAVVAAVPAAYAAAASDDDDFNYEDALDELSALAAEMPDDDEDEATATASIGSDNEDDYNY